MPLELPKYVVPRKRKDGSHRFYFQVPAHVRPDKWPSAMRLSDDVGEMFRQAEELYKRMQSENGGEPPQKMQKGSWPWLLAEYHRSDRYRSLSPRTQELYDYCARFISEWFTEARNPHVKYLTRPLAFKFLDRFNANPTKKKKIYVFMRVVLGYAVDLGEIETNPAISMRVKEPEAKIHIWKDEEIDAMILKADELGFFGVGNAILLGAETGQRQGDILRLKYDDHYKDGKFLIRQNKTKAWVAFPATKMLKARLEGRQAGFLVQTIDSREYSRDRFQRDYNRVREAAKLEHCIFMQLRHTALTNLARSGCSSVEIGSISGHSQNSINSMLDKYVMRDSITAENAVKKREIWSKTEVPNA